MDNVADVRAVIAIMLTADHGCHDCAGELVASFARHFPFYRDLAAEMYEGAFPDRTLEDYVDRIESREETEAWLNEDEGP